MIFASLRGYCSLKLTQPTHLINDLMPVTYMHRHDASKLYGLLYLPLIEGAVSYTNALM